MKKLVNADGTFFSLSRLTETYVFLSALRSKTCGRKNSSPNCFSSALQVPTKTIKNKHPIGCLFFMVQLMGLEPIRLPTRPSNVRVCQFRHSCILSFTRSLKEGTSETRKNYYTYIFRFVNTFFEKNEKTVFLIYMSKNTSSSSGSLRGTGESFRRSNENFLQLSLAFTAPTERQIHISDSLITTAFSQ